MFRLIQNIFHHLVYMRFGVSKCAVSILPAKLPFNVFFAVQPIGWTRFYLFNQFWNRYCRMHPNKNMGMVWVAINGIGFWFMIGYNATHHLFKFISEFFVYKVFFSLDCKNELHIKLSVCICHFDKISGLPPLCLNLQILHSTKILGLTPLWLIIHVVSMNISGQCLCGCSLFYGFRGVSPVFFVENGFPAKIKGA